MVTYLPEELGQAAVDTKEFFKGLASDIVGNAKNLFKDFPTGFVSGDPDSGLGAFQRAFWDSFFGRFPGGSLPSPPVPPFSGGQCSGIPYEVLISYRSGQFGNEQGILLFYCGPVGAVEEKPIQDGRTFVFVTANGPQGGGCSSVTCEGTESRNTGLWIVPGTLKVISVKPCGGVVDNCGSPPSTYPNKNLPPAVNPYVYVFPSPGGRDVSVPYSIDFDPTLIVPVVKVDLNGEVEIPVSFDAGGINLDVDLGGGGEDGGIPPEALDTLLDAASKIPGIQKNIEDLTRSGEQEVTDLGEQNGDSEGTAPGITGLITNVTNIPLGYGRKFGNPQVFDFGRVSFKRGNFYTSPVPITYVRQWHPAPVDADGYAVTLNPSVVADITVLTQKEI